MNKKRKIAIIGVGHVGSHVASMLTTRGICNELVLIDSDEKKMRGQAQDIADALGYQEKNCLVKYGDYEDISDADILFIAVSGDLFDENRLEELDDSMLIIDEIAPKIEESGFHGVVISITNPCDLVAYYLQSKISATVIGTGTALDSARLRVYIANALHVDVGCVDAFCIGEHGDSQVPVWSQVKIGGKKLEDVLQDENINRDGFDKAKIEKNTVYAGWQIADAKGSTEFGIGITASELAKAILDDANIIIPCSVMLQGIYGEYGLFSSVPCLVGAGGVKQTWEIPIAEVEIKAFHNSCKLLKQYISQKM